MSSSCECVVGGNGFASAPVGPGVDGGGRAVAGWDGSLQQRSGSVQAGDRRGRAGGEGGAGGRARLVVGRRGAGRGWGRGAPGSSAGGEGVRLPVGEE